MYKYTPHTHLNMNLGFYRPSVSSSKNCSNLGAPDHSLEIEVAVSAGEPHNLDNLDSGDYLLLSGP